MLHVSYSLTLGFLQDTTPDELLSAVMTAVLKDVGLSPNKLGDVCVGETKLSSPSESQSALLYWCLTNIKYRLINDENNHVCVCR